MWWLFSLASAVCQVGRNAAMKDLGHSLDEYINVWGRFFFLLRTPLQSKPSFWRLVMRSSNLDGFVKSRHPVKTGVQKIYNYLKELDSGFRRNDVKTKIQTFYEIIKFGWPDMDHLVSWGKGILYNKYTSKF